MNNEIVIVRKDHDSKNRTYEVSLNGHYLYYRTRYYDAVYQSKMYVNLHGGNVIYKDRIVYHSGV